MEKKVIITRDKAEGDASPYCLSFGKESGIKYHKRYKAWHPVAVEVIAFLSHKTIKTLRPDLVMEGGAKSIKIL
jgi:hypothetical protein